MAIIGVNASNESVFLVPIIFNELIYKLIPRNEPLPSLYNLYKDQLLYMDNEKISTENILLRFEDFAFQFLYLI